MMFRSKRGLDFGLGRGYSGSQVVIRLLYSDTAVSIFQAARHQLGLYQANYAGGPGK